MVPSLGQDLKVIDLLVYNAIIISKKLSFCINE
jgi:hypothetical protein